MAERELEKLKCYACNGKVCQMCYPCNEDVCQINSCQFKAWRKGYKADFVDKSYNPINIITGKSDAPVRGAKGENPEPAITESKEFDLEEMLNTLNEKIVIRSIEMTKIIDKENQCS